MSSAKRLQPSAALLVASLGFGLVGGLAQAVGKSAAMAATMPAQPLLGAEIWIEPGQTPAQIDRWFRQLADAHMPVARVILMWSHLEPAPGKWDFSLYDAAFRAAEKHHVRIVASLTPSGPPPFLGGNGDQGGGVVASEEQQRATALYLNNVVEHYKHSSALDTWLLLNEPGQIPAPQPLAVTAYRRWLTARYSSVEALNQSWGTAHQSFSEIDPQPADGGFAKQNDQLDWLDFWREYQSEQLHWLERQVRAHDRDPAHRMHVNPQMLISNPAGLSDDLPSWRTFLDSLGCSIHPSWHFALLARSQYALGVSYINDLVAGSIEPKPHWVTELQGGNNIYSAEQAMEPTREDIAQWAWISLGSGAQRVIFWLLNARRAGAEAAEWSLLDFQGRPSERLQAAAAVAQVVAEHRDFFSAAQPFQSPVTVVLSLETFTLEERYHRPDYPGRGVNAHLLEALGVYQALSQLGVPPRLKYFQDYDWDARSELRRTVILPDVRAITQAQVEELEKFVARGNTLLITGLTGFYDPRATAWPLAGFPLGQVTGADLKEVHFIGERLSVPLSSPQVTLPSHLWLSTLDNHSAQIIGQVNGEAIASERSTPSGGRVVWIPSPIGLGAWLGESRPLRQYLRSVLASTIASEAFKFAEDQSECLMRVLRSNKSWVSIVTNSGNNTATCKVEHPAGVHGQPLWEPASMQSNAESRATFRLAPRATTVILWR